MEGVLPLYRKSCDNRPFCFAFAHMEEDPCPTVSKYLEITYSCEQKGGLVLLFFDSHSLKKQPPYLLDYQKNILKCINYYYYFKCCFVTWLLVSVSARSGCRGREQHRLSALCFLLYWSLHSQQSPFEWKFLLDAVRKPYVPTWQLYMLNNILIHS